MFVGTEPLNEEALWEQGDERDEVSKKAGGEQMSSRGLAPPPGNQLW